MEGLPYKREGSSSDSAHRSSHRTAKGKRSIMSYRLSLFLRGLDFHVEVSDRNRPAHTFEQIRVSLQITQKEV